MSTHLHDHKEELKWIIIIGVIVLSLMILVKAFWPILLIMLLLAMLKVLLDNK
jgi:hypothetical protein